jgi:hypothetical protein
VWPCQPPSSHSRLDSQQSGCLPPSGQELNNLEVVGVIPMTAPSCTQLRLVDTTFDRRVSVAPCRRRSPCESRLLEPAVVQAGPVPGRRPLQAAVCRFRDPSKASPSSTIPRGIGRPRQGRPESPAVSGLPALGRPHPGQGARRAIGWSWPGTSSDGHGVGTSGGQASAAVPSARLSRDAQGDGRRDGAARAVLITVQTVQTSRNAVPLGQNGDAGAASPWPTWDTSQHQARCHPVPARRTGAAAAVVHAD